MHKQVYEVRRTNTVTTKLDAPYTLLCIRGQPSRIPVSNEVKGEQSRALNMDLQDLMPPESLTTTGTAESVAGLVQKLPKIDHQQQEAQGLMEQESFQAGQVLAKSQEKTKEERGRLTRKEQRTNRLEASKAQSDKAKERNRRVAEALKVIVKQHPKISGKLAKKRARRAVRGEERDSSSTFPVRFTSQEQEPYHKVTLQSGVQDAPPFTLRRHLSVSPGNSYQTHKAAPEKNFDVEVEHKSKYLPDDFKNEDKPDLVPIVREESEGKSPGAAHIGKEGNVFHVRKHLTMNPFERLQTIQEVGEITSKEQAMGLHGQYHLTLEEQPEGVRKS